jgi:hypothetical protein
VAEGAEGLLNIHTLTYNFLRFEHFSTIFIELFGVTGAINPAQKY